MTKDKYKKVLIVGAEVQPIPPVEGGAVELLVNFLIEENENNKFVDLTVVSPFTKKAEEESTRFHNTNFVFIKNANGIMARIIDFIDLFSRRFFSVSPGKFYIKKTVKEIKDEQYDLVVIENRPLYGKTVKKVYDGPIYLHLHNDFINKNTNINNKYACAYDKIIVISNYLKNRIKDTLEIPVEVIHNGIELERYCDTVSCTKEKTFIYTGRLVKEKGLLELVRAFNRINRDDCKLMILGGYDNDAENEDQFKKEFECLVADNKNIELIGYVDNNKIQDYYHRSYVGVVPSIVNEALSLTAIEMLASGLPVICSDAGGLPEVVDDSCGILVGREKLEDNLCGAMLKILKNSDEYKKMSSNAKRKSQQFSKESYLLKFKKLFTIGLFDDK